MQANRSGEGPMTAVNQSMEVWEKLHEWTKKAGKFGTNPEHEKLLQKAGWMVGAVVHARDKNGDFVFPHIREWIDAGRGPWATRRIKLEDTSGNPVTGADGKELPEITIPSDEVMLALILRRAGIPPELDILTLDAAKVEEYMFTIAGILGGIEKDVSTTGFSFSDWIKLLDDMDESSTRFGDMVSIGQYGCKKLNEKFAELAGKIDIAKRQKKLDDYKLKLGQEKQDRKSWTFWQRRRYVWSLGKYKPNQPSIGGGSSSGAKKGIHGWLKTGLGILLGLILLAVLAALVLGIIFLIKNF